MQQPFWADVIIANFTLQYRVFSQLALAVFLSNLKKHT